MDDHGGSGSAREFGAVRVGSRRGLMKAAAVGAAGLALAGGRTPLAGAGAVAHLAALAEHGRENVAPRSLSGFGASDGVARSSAGLPSGVQFDGTFGTLDEYARGPFEASGVPGLSIAIAKDGRLVYAQAFGTADRSTGEPLLTRHRFRVASVSKPITAVAIMLLVENGELDLDDTVFGDTGILGDDYGTKPYSDDLRAISVRHLLEHTAGWTSDPMYERIELDVDEIVTVGLDDYPLENTPPGRVHTYSNFGYCVLGRVIERISGRSYESFVQDNVFEPLGVTGMTIAGDTLDERQTDEAVYDGSGFGGDPYAMPVARMDSDGGWVASPTDLVRFVLGVDRLGPTPDILADATIAEMITPSAANPGYAKGWIVDSPDTYWHLGSFAGTESILVRTIDGFCFAAIVNGNGIDLYSLVSGMVQAIVDWPEGEAL